MFPIRHLRISLDFSGEVAIQQHPIFCAVLLPLNKGGGHKLRAHPTGAILGNQRQYRAPLCRDSTYI